MPPAVLGGQPHWSSLSRSPLPFPSHLTLPRRLGLKVAIADLNVEALKAVGREVQNIAASEGNVLVIPTDVSDLAQVQMLKDKVLDTWGEVCRIVT